MMGVHDRRPSICVFLYICIMTAETQFTKEPAAVGSCVGQNVALSWMYSVATETELLVTWQKDGSTILTWVPGNTPEYTYGTGYSSSKITHDGNGQITLKSLTENDNGVYVCSVTYTPSGRNEISINLKLTVSSAESCGHPSTMEMVSTTEEDFLLTSILTTGEDSIVTSEKSFVVVVDKQNANERDILIIGCSIAGFVAFVFIVITVEYIRNVQNAKKANHGESFTQSEHANKPKGSGRLRESWNKANIHEQPQVFTSSHSVSGIAELQALERVNSKIKTDRRPEENHQNCWTGRSEYNYGKKVAHQIRNQYEENAQATKVQKYNYYSPHGYPPCLIYDARGLRSFSDHARFNRQQCHQSLSYFSPDTYLSDNNMDMKQSGNRHGRFIYP